MAIDGPVEGARWAIVLFLLSGFEVAVSALSPGVPTRSRWVYGLTTVLLSPVLWIAVKQGPVLPIGVGALLWSVAAFSRAVDTSSGVHGAAFLLMALMAALFYPPTALVSVPLAFVLTAEYPRWRLGIAVFGAFAVAGALWSYAQGVTFGWPPSTEWSLRYLFFKSTGAPNIVLLWQPLAHPRFFLLLPTLFLLFKRTDVSLYTRRVLVWCWASLMLYYSGVHVLEPAHLLLGYVLLLLLLFPAWDRFFAYGRYFFPRLTLALLGLAVAVQVIALIFYCC
jgi:hypothetical protein